MKSSIRFSSIAAAIAVSTVAMTSAFAATYVPHENNFFPNDATTRGTVTGKATPADTRMSKSMDTMQSASSKKTVMTENTLSFRRTEGAAQ